MRKRLHYQNLMIVGIFCFLNISNLTAQLIQKSSKNLFASSGFPSYSFLKNDFNLKDQSEESLHFHEAAGIAHTIPYTAGICVANTVNRFVGTYHSNMYIGNSSGTNVVLAWGQLMLNYTGTGAGNITTPTIVSNASYSGVPLEVRGCSTGGATGESVLALRTSTNLYFFGTLVNLTAITSMANFGALAINAANSNVTAKLPAGVAISDIVQMEVSKTAFAIVTNTGAVYVLTKVQNLQGDAAAADPAIWHQVKLSGGVTNLTGVKKLSLSSSGAFALTNTGKIYYWGSPANVAGAINTTTSYAYAFDMSAQIPVGKTVTDLVVLGTSAPSNSTLFILCDDKKVYSCGLNTTGVLGVGNATTTFNQATFVAVTGLTNIVKIDGDTEADLFTMVALSGTGQLYGWGNSQAGMLGVPAVVTSATTNTTNATPFQIFTPNPAGVNFTDFSVAGHFTIAFYTNGSIDQYWYLGHNTGGSIGDPLNVTTYLVAAAPASLNATGGVSFDCSNATLPVEFLGFYGKWNNDQVALNWKTAFEMNTAYFEIERSADGINFWSLGTVAAAGNSNYENRYNFMDLRPLSGANYYRLKTTDIDGRSQYSSVLKLNKQAVERFQVSPNPFQSSITVQVTLANKEQGTIRLIDQNGKLVYSSSRFLEAGTNTISINELSKMAPGVYLVEVDFGGVRSTQQVLKTN